MRNLRVRPEFRFPRSTVFLMSIIFGGVILAMEKASTIQVKYAAGAGRYGPRCLGFWGSLFSSRAPQLWSVGEFCLH